ncbi:MAG: cytochrome c-550 PedF [Proteobacteria bacterium]|nr:cytochrome c-550 PedF [Pseudomonadota bacterium]
MHITIRSMIAVLLLAGSLATSMVQAHGSGSTEPMDIGTLRPLGETLLDENPYRGDKEAIKIGESAYGQQCARCHGIQGISGGMSPDLRQMDVDKENDKIYLDVTLRGSARNGKVYMPPFKGILPQELIWAIRSYTDSRPKE